MLKPVLPWIALSAALVLPACGDDTGDDDDDDDIVADASSDIDAPTGDIDASLEIDAADFDAGPAVTSLDFEGPIEPIEGAEAPAQSLVEVIWTGQKEDLVKHGDGTATQDAYHLTVDGPPPNAALLGATLGVGLVVMLPDGTVLPADGAIVDEQTLEETAIGFSGQHAIIYLASEIDEGWPADFPVGFACAVCVPSAQKGEFDTWAPADCADVVLQAGDGNLAGIEPCNWF